jgi:nitrate reductase gamma subunit
MMTSVELYTWVRGPALQAAVALFLLGLTVRLFELWMLGRKTDLSVPRAGGFWPGLRTIFTRSVPAPGLLRRAALVYLGGYIFHLGFFITLLFFVPHILLFKGAVGLSWPGLPSAVVDLTAIITIAALIALLVHRLTDPVRRHLSGVNDYLSWALTILPLLTGYMAVHRLLLPYTSLLVIHVLSVELLLIALPFTKLVHAVTFLISRSYNGAIAGRRGVQA